MISSSTSQARVLLVDDELHVRSALARSLSLLGYHADKAGSGSEALKMLRQAPYDVLVLDIRMPGMDGIEVMHRVQELYPDLMIIILTGHATLESAIAAVKSGAVDYLRKPVSVHDIASAAAKALQRRAERSSLDSSGTVQGKRLTSSPSSARESGKGSLSPPSESLLHVGPVYLDQEKLLITIVGDDESQSSHVRLTVSETMLMAYMMVRPGTVVSCLQLAEGALGYSVSEEEAQGIIRPHVSRLRNKIRQVSELHLIRTILGKGYLFSTWSPGTDVGAG